MDHAEKFFIEYTKRDELPPTSESVRRERSRKIFGQRSPRITVSHNRIAAQKIGSLSPDLLKKLNAKHHFDDESRANTPSRKKVIRMQAVSQPSSQKPTPAVEQEQTPRQYIEKETIRDLL